MTSKKTPICFIKTTADIGFDRETKRYYCFFDVYIFKTQKAFIVSAQCDDYNVMDDTMKNFTIEFLTYADHNNTAYPYDKELFQEIEFASMDVFSDLKAEEKVV